MHASNRLICAAFCLLLPSLAHAHAGAGAASGFISGFAHPLGGPDHLLAMLAVGIWAAQTGQRPIWAAPLAFVAAMGLGGASGMFGGAVSFGELGIVASVLVTGVLIAAAVRLPTAASVGVVGLFAVFHGQAHGAELPENVSGIAFGLGFILSTALLHLCGVSFSLLMRRIVMPQLIRVAGVFVALFGGYLVLAG